MPMAKVVGKDPDGNVLYGSDIGIDSRGRAWLLVRRAERQLIGGGRRLRVGSILRMRLARWHLIEPFPFVTDPPLADVFDARDGKEP
jgi:hypothetical protein